MDTRQTIERAFRRRIDKIFLAHIWLCVPFARIGLLLFEQDPERGGMSAHRVAELRAIALPITFYLLFRSFIVLRGKSPHIWNAVWPLADAVWITLILGALRYPISPVALLYLVPITYAAFTLTLRGSLLVGGLCVAGYFASGLPEQTWWADPQLLHPDPEHPVTIAFRMAFLMLMASLISFVGRESMRLRESLSLTQYQRDLSAELHDGIQHDLVLIARRLDLVDALRNTDPTRAAEIAVEQREVARRAFEEIRLLVRGLREDTGNHEEFMKNLRAHLSAVGERAGIPVTLECTGEPGDLPDHCRHPLLRIIQEAMTNAIKHASASAIEVQLTLSPDHCEARIRDNGQGFDLDRATPGTGLGTMATRAKDLGGTYRILSEPGKGTEVVVSLPTRVKERKALFHGHYPRSRHRG